MDIRDHPDTKHDTFRYTVKATRPRYDMWMAASNILGCSMAEFITISCDIASEELLKNYRGDEYGELSKVVVDIITRFRLRGRRELREKDIQPD